MSRQEEGREDDGKKGKRRRKERIEEEEGGDRIKNRKLIHIPRSRNCITINISHKDVGSLPAE